MTTPSQPPLSAAEPSQESLLSFPCEFPIKVMGRDVPGYREAVIAVAQSFDPGLDLSKIETRHSSGGHYLGLTVTVTATSRAMLDDLYRALTSHPMVKVVL